MKIIFGLRGKSLTLNGRSVRHWTILFLPTVQHELALPVYISTLISRCGPSLLTTYTFRLLMQSAARLTSFNPCWNSLFWLEASRKQLWMGMELCISNPQIRSRDCTILGRDYVSSTAISRVHELKSGVNLS
jgi:hypothetical protein